MTYIANLQIKVDTTQVESATQKLKEFTQATSGTAQAESTARKARQDSSKSTIAAEQKASQAEQSRYDQWFQMAARRDKEEALLQQRRDAIMARDVKDSAASLARKKKAADAEAIAEQKRYDQWLQLADKRTQAELKQQTALEAARSSKKGSSPVDDRIKQAQAAAAAESKALKDALSEQQRIDKIRYQSTLRRYNEEEKLAAKTEKQRVKAASSVEQEAKSMQNLLAAIDPVTREMQRLDQLEKSLQANRGKLTTEQYTKYSNAIEEARKKSERYNDALGRTALTTKQLRMAQMGLPAQFTDIVVSLQGGQAPLTVLLQQGGQIKDMFGGLGPAIRGVSSAIWGMVNPATVVAAGVITLGAAWYDGAGQLEKLNKAIISSGNIAGVTAGQLRLLGEANAGGMSSIRQNIEALGLLVENGKLVPDTYARVAEAATAMSQASGVAIDKIVDDFTSLGKEPVEAAEKLNEKYNFLTASTHAQAQALVEQGREQEAIKLLTNELADVMADRGKKMEESARGVAAAWRTVTNAVSDAWTAAGTRLNPTFEDDLRDINTKIANYESKLDPGEERDTHRGYQFLLAERQKLVESIYDERNAAADEREERKKNNAAIKVQTEGLKKQQAAYSAVKKAQVELAEFERGVVASGNKLSPDEVTKYRKVYTDALKKAQDEEKKKLEAGTPKSAILDNTDVNELKNRVNEIKAQYATMNQAITQQQAAGTLSSEAGFAKRKSLLTEETAKIKEAYEKQIAALEALKGSKNISANQTISLDRQIADARSKMVVAQEDSEKRLAKLAGDEEVRIRKQTQNIAAYNKSLQQLIDNLKVAGERERAGISQTSGERELSGKLNAEDDRYADEVRRLNDQAAENPQLASEVDAKLKLAASNHSVMKDQIVKNYDEMQAAQRDWGAGVSSAFKQYIEDGQNYANLTNQAFTSAFGHMEDAMYNFVTTGKLSFADLTKSILADMARIATRMAASNALTALFGAWGGAQAPASQSMNSATTYDMGMAAAKGAAFNTGGTQFFAKGGAFTNSVVSKPTAFGSASSPNNIMGEAGPEAIMPLTRGSDGSLGVRASVDVSGLQQQGGGVQVNIHIDGQGNASSESSDPGYSNFGQEVGQFVDQRYRQLVSKDLAPGGEIWKSMQS